MPTDTQRNFRKQMETINKELEEKSQYSKGFYSYIERDQITSYYEKKKKKRTIIATISIGSLLLLLWNSYAIYTWIQPVIYSVTGKQLPAISNPINIGGSKQQKIGDYLRQVTPMKERVNEMLQYRSRNLNAILQNNLNREEFFKEIQNYSSEIKEMTIDIQQVKVPKEMSVFQQEILNMFEITYKIFVYTQELEYANDNKRINENIGKTNDLISELNIVGYKSTQELTKVFNGLKISYQEIDGKIHFTLWE